MRQLKRTLLLCSLAVGGFCIAFGQSEHPDSKEHPTSEHPDSKEHPQTEHPEEKEHPDDSKDDKQQMTVKEFADAAENYIKKKSEKNNGYFIVKDQKTGEKLNLKLTKVHRKRLSHLGNNRYFVCANFKSKDGTLYDIDIFMTGTNPDNLKATKDPMVHKVEGDARFNYIQEDGVWKRNYKNK